ncbi:MAG: hypothetical protein E6R03_06420 [Hyphomicrobiaceae bacterium]|nr:MAG: hypothetical protein E6R03_06420 [Hyphomicrobiaceae bacterium]
MAIVSLKRDWFDPEGKLWSARNNPHEMDEALLAELPTGSIVDGVDPKAEETGKAATAKKRDLKESQEQGLAEKEREEKIVQKAESEHNDKAHAAVVNKTATPPKL